MPADFPPWDRAYAFFRRWRGHLLVKDFHDRLRARVREKLGRDVETNAGVIDSQSVKADAVVGSDSRGYDGGKQINGQAARRARHARPAAGRDGHRSGHRRPRRRPGPLYQVADAHHRLALVWADGGYTGSLVEYCLATLALVLAIVKRSDDTRGFVVLPKR